MLTSTQGSEKVNKNKRRTSKLLTISICLLIVMFFSYSFYKTYSIKNEIKNIEIDYIINKQDEIINDSLDEKQKDIISDSEIKEKEAKTPISNSLNETKNTKKDVNIKKKNTSNKSNSSSEKQVPNSNKEQNENKVETTIIENKKETPAVEQKKQKGDEKSIEIVIETPDEESFKNDSAYINLMKQIFSTFNECDKKGDEVRIGDMDNILSSSCEAVYYKGTEIGWKLKIKSVDGTFKYYKK